MAKSMMGLAFALQVYASLFRDYLETNAIPATFWLVASLTCLPDDERKDVLDCIRRHVIPGSGVKESVQFHIDELSQDSVQSPLSERLRLHANGLSPEKLKKTIL